MLILSRKERETILVGDNIEITVCRVAGGRVKLGLRAPNHVSIRRGELSPSRELPDSDVQGQNLHLNVARDEIGDIGEHAEIELDFLLSSR